MHGLTTIHKLNEQAAEAARIMNKHRYLETLTDHQRFCFSQLTREMQELIVSQWEDNNSPNRKLTNIETR